MFTIVAIDYITRHTLTVQFPEGPIVYGKLKALDHLQQELTVTKLRIEHNEITNESILTLWCKELEDNLIKFSKRTATILSYKHDPIS